MGTHLQILVCLVTYRPIPGLLWDAFSDPLKQYRVLLAAAINGAGPATLITAQSRPLLIFAVS